MGTARYGQGADLVLGLDEEALFTVAELEDWQAIALSVGLLVVAWVVYDILCRVLGRDGAWGIRGLSDWASLPLLLLSATRLARKTNRRIRSAKCPRDRCRWWFPLASNT